MLLFPNSEDSEGEKSLLQDTASTAMVTHPICDPLAAPLSIHPSLLVNLDQSLRQGRAGQGWGDAPGAPTVESLAGCHQAG